MLKIKVTVEQRELDRYLKKLDKNRGKPLLYRAENTTWAAARYVVGPIRAEMPTGRGTAKRKPGNLKRRVHVRRLRKRGGEVIRPTWVGSSAYYMRFYGEGTAGHLLHREGGVVKFTTRYGEHVNFTMKEGARSGYAVFPEARDGSRVRSLIGMWHPGAKGDAAVARAWGASERHVYSLIERDVWDTK